MSKNTSTDVAAEVIVAFCKARFENPLPWKNEAGIFKKGSKKGQVRPAASGTQNTVDGRECITMLHKVDTNNGTERFKAGPPQAGKTTPDNSKAIAFLEGLVQAKRIKKGFKGGGPVYADLRCDLASGGGMKDDAQAVLAAFGIKL